LQVLLDLVFELVPSVVCAQSDSHGMILLNAEAATKENAGLGGPAHNAG